MVDLRKVVVIFVIAVLFSILVFSTIEAVYPRPKYDDFCSREEYPKPVLNRNAESKNCSELIVPEDFREKCNEKDGRIDYKYDAYGCAVDYSCETCHNEYDKAQEFYNMFVFIIAALSGLVAIIIALYLPATKELNEWIGTGFMLGGLFTLFFGTAMYFGDMARYLRPIIIFLELVIVIFLAYKKLSTPKDHDKGKNKSKNQKNK